MKSLIGLEAREEEQQPLLSQLALGALLGAEEQLGLHDATEPGLARLGSFPAFNKRRSAVGQHPNARVGV